MNKNKMNRPPAGLWLTDFDGTIKPHLDEPVAEADLAALRRLGHLGWFRVVVTGRSLFGLAKVWRPGLDFDALIFSSGVGLCAWSPMGPGPFVVHRTFEPGQFVLAQKAAQALGYGFFAYHEPPDCHHFYYLRPAKTPLGFDCRLKIFASQARPWPGEGFDFSTRLFSQIMIMVPAAEVDQAEAEFRTLAPGLSVLRSSSPFGDDHIWLEVFPPGVSKGAATAELAASLGLGAGDSVALGNDYNDLDMLKWAGRAFVADDAPLELLALFPAMPAAGQGGLAWAANQVLGPGDD